MIFYDLEFINYSLNEENTEETENEGFNNENTENTELYYSDNIQNSTDNNYCTEVYDPVTYELTCAEYLIPQEEKTEEEIQKEEEEIEYKEELIETIKNIKNNQEELMKADETVTAIELYESMNEKLDSIYDYLSIFIGLYFIGWIFAQMNTWRRNNK